MIWEKLELVGVNVTDLDQAVADFTEIFGCEFEVFDVPSGLDIESLPVDDTSPKNIDLSHNHRAALDRGGKWELVEVPAELEGVRNVHYKVDDLDKAIATLTGKGLKLVSHYRVGFAREAVFIGDRLHGVRLALLQYDGDIAVDPVLARKN